MGSSRIHLLTLAFRPDMAHSNHVDEMTLRRRQEALTLRLFPPWLQGSATSFDMARARYRAP
jgi:hypothetical protein